MNRTLQHIKKGMFFSFVFILVYLAFLLLFSLAGKSSPITKLDTNTSTFNKFSEYTNTNKIDIIFLGSSVILQGIDPRIFDKNGISIFNMGTKLQTPVNSYYFYKSLLKESKNHVKLVIVDVNMFVLSVESDESTFDIISNTPFSKENISLCLKSKNPMTFNTLFSSFLISSKIENQTQDTNYHIVPRGFLESVHNENSNKKLNKCNLEIKKDYWEYYSKIAALAKKNNSKIIFITQPSPSRWKNSVINYKSNKAAIDSFFTIQNLKYIDFNERCTFNDNKDYLDHLHLSKNGVEKYNQILIKELKSIPY